MKQLHNTCFILLIGILLFGSACSKSQQSISVSTSPQRPPFNTDLNWVPDVQFDLTNVLDQRRLLLNENRRLTLTLQWITGGDGEFIYALVSVVNKGGTAELVFPIDPLIYDIEYKHNNGEIESVVNVPPIDLPVFREDELVILRPHNVLAGVIRFPSKALIEDARFRVSVHLHYRGRAATNAGLVEVRLSSEWIPGPPKPR